MESRTCFRCRVEQAEPMLPCRREKRRGLSTKITFTFYKVPRSCSFQAPTRLVEGPRELVATEDSSLCLYDMLIERPRYTALVAEKLSSLHVPDEAQAAVIYKLFQLVETAYPAISISVDVYEVTVRFFGGATSRPEELLARSLCATRLMRLISDEDEPKMMDLLYAKKSSYEPRLRLIPAATNSCIEEGEAQPQLRNMLLMSAGGILTTSACFALRMIETKLKINVSDRLLYFMPLVAMYASKFW